MIAYIAFVVTLALIVTAIRFGMIHLLAWLVARYAAWMVDRKRRQIQREVDYWRAVALSCRMSSSEMRRPR